MKKLILILTICNLQFATTNIFAQGATCATAVPLAIGACTGPVTLTDGVMEGGTPTLPCLSGGGFRREGWFSFTTTGAQNLTITATNSLATTNVAIQIISGTCGSILTLLACENTITTSCIQTEACAVSIAAAGTYFIRITNIGALVDMPMDNVCLNVTPANNDCAGAIQFGVLPAPIACGIGSVVSLNATNIGATPEFPYLSIASCGMAASANTVWFSFVAPTAGTGVQIEVTSATFANPNIALWQGSICAGLTGVGCIVGSSGNAVLNIPTTIIPDSMYLIMVSGNAGDTGTFVLNINSSQMCNNCVNATTLTASPPPASGMYAAGQVVSFCYHVSRYNQLSNNWLHGVQLNFGAGWDVASLVTYPPPNRATGNCGIWSYYAAGCYGSASFAFWPAGFYFDEDFDLMGICYNDANPGNNFGDGTSCIGCVVNTLPTEWNFCFDIAVASTASTGDNLCVTVNTTSDGESGQWTDNSCSNDYPANVCATAFNISTNLIETIKQQSDEFNIYPNPSNGFIQLTTNHQPLSTIKITNLLGESILTPLLWRGAGGEAYVDISAEPNGVYFIQLNDTIYKKIIKQ